MDAVSIYPLPIANQVSGLHGQTISVTKRGGHRRHTTYPNRNDATKCRGRSKANWARCICHIIIKYTAINSSSRGFVVEHPLTFI